MSVLCLRITLRVAVGYKMLELVCSKCIEEFACGSAISVRRKIDRRTYFVFDFCTLPGLTGQDRIEICEE